MEIGIGYTCDFWINPEKTVTKLMIIEFNKDIKKIKKIKIEEEKIRINRIEVDSVISKAENLIKQLSKSIYLYKNIIEKEKYKTSQWTTRSLQECCQIIGYMERELQVCKDYLCKFIHYKSCLCRYSKQYIAMKHVLSGRNICCSCLCNFDKNLLTVVKKRNKMCTDCYKKNIEKIDCPICLEYFKHSEMQKIKCGNNHHICKKCYGILKSHTDREHRCPLCRGTL